MRDKFLFMLCVLYHCGICQVEPQTSLRQPKFRSVIVGSLHEDGSNCPPDPCSNSRCQNGYCHSLSGGYMCICDECYRGTYCDQEVVIIPPTIEVHPVATTGELYQSTNLTCNASGNPMPHIIWYKDNVVVPNNNSDPSVLFFDELRLDDRGFYRCEAIISCTNDSDVSEDVVLNIRGVVQYDAFIDLPQNTSQEMIDRIISQIEIYLSENNLTENFISPVQIMNSENIDFNNSQQMIPIVITLETEEGGSEELLREVQTEIQLAGEELDVDITVDTVDRFDGCRSNITDISSYSGNPNLTISIEWPETNIGELAEVDCPCGNITSQEGSLIATRYCGGDFTNGSQWENPNAAACNFSDLAREICQLAELETAARVQQLVGFTENSDLEPTEVIVSVAVLLTATEEVSGNISMTNDFLNVVDNIINVDVETLQESQESSNTSAKILESIESVVERIPVGNVSEPVVITRSAFAVSVQQVDLDQFIEIGQTFSANLGTFSDLNMSVNIDSNDLSFDMGSNQSIASISLPNNFFSATPDVINNTRITHAVFLTDSLFLRRENNDMEVGSIIISASLVGSNSVEGIDPLNITFLKNPNISGSDPQCSFWNPMLDDGYGDWSSEGCEIDESYNESQDIITCFCNHLTSFCVLLDVSPEIKPPEIKPSEGTLALEAVTYIGIIISIFCLLITIISYLSTKELRTSDHGQLLVNLCFALMGLYITFIFALHSRTVTGLCALSAAVLQYFFLVTFLLMAAEAINLYMKLVIVLGANIPHYVLKATIISWLTPIFIVLFCFAPNYKNYVSDHFCRAFNIPYYIGMVVPFLIIYIFNWTVFFIIIVTLLHKSCKSDLKDVKEKQENISFIRRQLIIVITLSVLFGLGWGIGLFATQDIHNNKAVRDVFAALFVIVTAFHGLFIFVMQCLRSKDVRSVWKQWFYRITGKDFSDFSSSTYGRIRRPNTSRTDSTPDGANLKQYFSKQSLTSPGGDSSVFTFDDNTVEIDSGKTDTLKDSVDKSSFPLSLQEDAIMLENLGKDEEEVGKQISKEEQAGMVESSFNETTIALDCDDDKKETTKEEEAKMVEFSFTPTLKPTDDHTEIPDIPVDTSSPNM